MLKVDKLITAISDVDCTGWIRGGEFEFWMGRSRRSLPRARRAAPVKTGGGDAVFPDETTNSPPLFEWWRASSPETQ